MVEAHGPGADATEDVRAFRAAVDDGRGALCIAVYRGKLSEGISFNDDYARLVVCVGVPFPSVADEQLKAKRAFNDLPSSRAEGLLSGAEWYKQQAFRALNQALGRCVRHRDDWGTIALIDERFANAGERLSISQCARRTRRRHSARDPTARHHDTTTARWRTPLPGGRGCSGQSGSRPPRRAPARARAHRPPPRAPCAALCAAQMVAQAPSSAADGGRCFGR